MPEEIKADVVEETEVDATADAEELAGFEAAMNDTPLPAEKKEEADVEVEKEEEKDEPPAKTEPEKVEPKLATITEEQFTHLVNTAKTVDELKAGLKALRDEAFGKMGGIERTLKDAENRVDSGLDIELTDEDFKEVEEELPMLSKPLQKLLKSMVKKAKVKVPGGQKVDLTELQSQIQTEIRNHVEETIKAERVETYKATQRELLTDRFPDWTDVVQKAEFKDWIEKEDKTTPGYLAMFQRSWSAQEIGGVLKKFNAHQEAAEKAKIQPTPPKLKPKVPSSSNSRVQRLMEAIPPKGSSVTPKPKGELTEEEAFEAAAG